MVSVESCVYIFVTLIFFFDFGFSQMVISESIDAIMKGAKVTKHDEYLCSAHRLPVGDKYIVQYEAIEDIGQAHHILLFGCKEPASNSMTWHCGKICKSTEQILFAWAKNAPPLVLPKDVGFHVSGSTDIKYVVVQVHYTKPLPNAVQADHSGIRLHVTSQQQFFDAGIFLLLSYSTIIRPHQKKVHSDISCQFKASGNIYPFGYRTHAHSLSRVIAGYQVNKTSRSYQFNMIGKGNPQWPQSFYPVKDKIVIKPGDFLVGRCTYDSTSRNRNTFIGATAEDEMCNFYIMYYTPRGTNVPSHTCAGKNIPSLLNSIPADSDVDLPPNPKLEAVAHGHHGHMGNPEGHDGPSTTTSTSTTTTTPQPTQKLGNDDILDQLKNRLNEDDEPYSHGNSRHHGNSQNIYPREYHPDYNDYYDNVEMLRNRKRFRHPSYDYYDENDDRDTDRYRYFGNNDKIDIPVTSVKNRNRHKLFDVQNSSRRRPYKTKEESGDFGYYNNNVHRISGKKGAHYHPFGPNNDGVPYLSTRVPNLSKTSKHHPTHYMGQSSVFGAPLPMLKNLQLTSEALMGQIAGVTTDKQGNVYVFHRADRVWDQSTFNWNNVLLKKDSPISFNTIVIYNKNGQILRQLGSNLFFMPHGIEVDENGNIWVTDVGLHQIMRIPAGKDMPDVILGEKFVPGTDLKHFCKPSDIIVLKTGEFYISDGYCNARIIKYDKDGNVIKVFGSSNTGERGPDGYPLPGQFNIPHSMTLVEDRGWICVADRENGRVQCFDLNGNFQKQYHPKEFGPRLFAVEYCPLHGGILFAVNGPSGPSSVPVQGIIVDLETGETLETFNTAQGLQNPHDIAVDPINLRTLVVELSPYKLWTFDMNPDYTKPITTTSTSSSSSSSTSSSTTTSTTTTTVTTILPEKTVLPQDDLMPAFIIGGLLIIPVIVIIIVIIIVRMRKGQYNCCRQHRSRSRKKFNLGNFLTPHKGFDRLSMEESDTEFDPLNDSEEEEYSLPRKA